MNDLWPVREQRVVTRDDFRPNNFRHRADLVREIPLEVVLRCWGAVRDRQDKSRWHTSCGPLSVTGSKFFNWHDHQGGGGAIDLVMHLGECSARQAIGWLWRHHGGSQLAGKNAATGPGSTSAGQLRLPKRCPAHLQRVRHYLHQRGLSETIVASLVDGGKLYADGRGNAVFLMVAGKPNRPIGAELRGTGNCAWRGLAPGTRKNAGYFWVGKPGSRQIILCESAIDAISCFQLQTCGPCICISTAGVRSTAPWLDPLLDHGYQIHCGFDNDKAGNDASRQMIQHHPSIRRLLPPAHDWNDALRSD